MSTSSTPELENSIPALLARWWLWIPAKLRRYSGLLSAAWGDGLYLNAWPRMALLLPVLVFLIGFFTGATHWGFRVIEENYVRPFFVGTDSPHLTALLSKFYSPFALARQVGPAISFAQLFSLLVLTAGIGAFSAQLGLMLVLGYAAGDFFLAGPPAEWVYRYPGLAAHFFHLTIPQLVSYLAFFLLAVLPTLNTRMILVDLMRRGKLERLARLPGSILTALTIAVMAVAQGLFVYAWTFIAPMIIRISWTWAGQGRSPINITHFQSVTEVWLPAVAVACFLLRCWLEHRVGKTESLFSRVQAVLLKPRAENWQVNAPGRLSTWLQVMFAAVLVTVLSIGFLWSITAGIVFLVIVCGIFWVRAYILPTNVGWRNWTRQTAKLPLAIRCIAAIAGSYLITRCILTIDLRRFHRISPVFKSFSASVRDKVPSDFWVELLCIILSLLLALALLPEGSSRAARQSSSPKEKATNAQWLMGALLFFSVGNLNYCLDTYCCFGASDLLVALMIAALLWEILPFLLVLSEIAIPLLEGGLATLAGDAGVLGVESFVELEGEEAVFDAAIQEGLSSSEEGIQLEAQVATAIKDAGIQIIRFRAPVLGPTGPIGEIDIETSEAIIEVTINNSGKLRQISKYLTNYLINPSGKPVVLFSKEYGYHASKAITKIGASVMNNLPDLISLLKNLKIL